MRKRLRKRCIVCRSKLSYPRALTKGVVCKFCRSSYTSKQASRVVKDRVAGRGAGELKQA